MSVSPSAYRFESELAQLSPRQRRERGVFYTPWEVAQAVVRQVDQTLKQQFALPLGLADSSSFQHVASRAKLSIPSECNPEQPFVQILEPSCGTGIFLVAALQQMAENVLAQGKQEGLSQSQANLCWQRFVEEQLPQRIAAIELMPGAIDEAHQTVSQFFQATGISKYDPAWVPIHCGNTLELEVHQELGSPATVILGNPPYAAASANNGLWIKELLRGKVGKEETYCSYFEAEGVPLQEKKLWLHDDYVKFLRVSQWHLERAGLGVIGLVVNHGFLDNVTFRGLRYQLLRQFDRLELLDLNGNSKKRGTAAFLSRDESVFDIGQGVAISICSRSQVSEAAEVQFGQLWGNREDKLQTLSQQGWNELVDQTLRPQSPHFFLVPRPKDVSAEYSQGISITELFRESTSTVVTARDSLVIDTSEERLLARLEEFRDAALTDEEIRTKYFPRPRSGKYPPGDTRGWKLSGARSSLREDPEWRSRLARCAYRPFDQRWIYWSTEMIDWPRGDVMDEMQKPEALALIVRRQMPADRPANYFWIADALTVDGIVRSDNRGNETLLPLSFLGNENINRDLLPEYLRGSVGGEAIVAMIYALFHSSEYRTHFASMLQIEFPRLFFPVEKMNFECLATLGQKLITLHLGKATWERETAMAELGPVAAGYPKYHDGQVWIDRRTPLAEVHAADWAYHVGSHQVLKKWLKDRRHQMLSAEDICHYLRMIQAIRETRETIARIDQEIEKLGGLHRAFGIERNL
ncbi:type ISP restriction/modification enzyme [Bremerella cremea]|uniref:type ISP restriction/modification enzyme n=1 Tax=Bremerella cremea TaxID=1031537 RepID=UPI0031E8CDC2